MLVNDKECKVFLKSILTDYNCQVISFDQLQTHFLLVAFPPEPQ
jgi:hypothetical protein